MSLKHTNPRDPFISFWRPERKGYCWPLTWAGLYDEADARELADGTDTVAVPWSAALALAKPPRKGLVDGNAGPVVARRHLGFLRAVGLGAQTSPAAGALDTELGPGRPA